ncbi:zinc ribbon domain-containing protein [Clostridium estertheticum]|uniref:zinc ribbon domain-containing protein n=1 Tax=Clostridium estertheticum TaxID=238834 RepID=UPI001CF5620B|nr:zinc ribbon domain-containing protein [Clostridium estertheticum]MCB2354520.1 zinc ribbon domain-containing protein [Clostridium estertheticum]WAG42370.1 zinc ribbon domain-containing protein [Clostridium estertheticum]
MLFDRSLDRAEFTGILKCACCGHTMQVQKKRDGKSLIKACSYVVNDKGDKCINRGGYLGPVKDEIKKAVLKYREEVLNFLKNDNCTDDVDKITHQIQVKYKELIKYEDALMRVKDSFDLGDYTREEFLTRKEKWKEKIDTVEEQISIFEKELKQQKSISDDEKILFLIVI